MEHLRLSNSREKVSIKKYLIIALGLFATVVVVLCVVFASKSNNTSVSITPKSCDNVSEGLKKLNRAVDITSLDLLPISSASISAEFGRPVFEFTCNKGKRWTDPLTSITYDLPDQVEAINSLPSEILDMQSTIYESFEDVKMDIATGAYVNYKEGMFSASASYRRAQELMANNSNYVSEVTAYFSAFQADLTPYWATAPSENFLRFIKDQLPNRYEENPQKYEELFREYGTHYFSGGNFGGLFRLRIAFDKTLRSKMSAKNIIIAINGTFFDFLNIIGFHSDSSYKVDSKFQSSSQVSARYYGGNAPIEGPVEWDKWSQSVPKNPWLLSGHLSEITNLIPEGDGKKEAVGFAIETHLTIAYLEDMVINVNYYLKRNNVEEKNKTTANKFIKRSEDILSKTPVNVSDAKSLSLEIKEFLFENQPPTPEIMSEFGFAQILVISADVPDKRFLPIRPDPFVKVYAGGYLGKTSVASGTTRPYWNNAFSSPKIHVSTTIRFDIYDEKIYRDVYLDTVSTSVKDILRSNLNATETSLFPYDLLVKITWRPSMEQ